MNAVVERHLFAHLRRLAALPEALTELLRTLDDENANQRTITLTISRDLSLTCKMLRIANSSFYGLAYHVASVQDALMILGLRTVRSLAIATLLTTHLQKWAGSLSSLRHFFEHSLGSAIYSQLLAKHISIQGDAAFTAGLLHDTLEDTLATPAELEKEFGKGLGVAEVQQKSRAYAAVQIERQKADFIRLGVLGEWDRPYLTMNFRNEADEIRALGKLIEKGYVYRGLKPVNWCFDCGSALAEAEVEYIDRKDPAAVWVRSRLIP